MKEYYERLKMIYSQVEEGQCKGCTNCCSESVNMSYVEFKYVYDHYFLEGGILSHEALTRRILKYYLLELVLPMKCPFLNENERCEIYNHRPLPCRLFGNTTESAYKYNYRAVRKQNLVTAKSIFLNEGYKLPKRVLEKEIAFCEKYKATKKFDQVESMKLYDQLINMDGELVFRGKMKPTQFNQNLVGWFIDAIMEEACQSVISREILETLRRDVLKTYHLRRHVL